MTAQCHVGYPVVKRKRIVAVVPAKKPSVYIVDPPISFSSYPLQEAEKMTCILDFFIRHPKALKSFLIALEVSIATLSLPTWRRSNAQ